MRFKHFICTLLVVLISNSAINTAIADEGMWPFNNVPREEIKQRYGFAITDAWLKRIQLASVRFNNGGSGSFVSANGLVLTNHHIASDVLSGLSTGENDYLAEGFYARALSQEIKVPGLELDVLVSIDDVTNRVNAAIKTGQRDADANRARAAEIAAIEKESLADTGTRGEVVTLYQGGQYNLYRYRQYRDVRLVFAPELNIAFFGGDEDNFNFPRYDLDMVLFRVYEDGKPIKVDNYLKWSKSGAKDGELVFTSGHPILTGRLNTLAHLENLRDTELPFLLKWLGRKRSNLVKYAAQGEDQKRRVQANLINIENAIKSFQGQHKGLQDGSLLARKRQAEQSLRQSIAADPAKQNQYGNAWDAIAKGRRVHSGFYTRYRMLERTAGFASGLFLYARALVRMAAESTKPDAERLPEYTEARRASFERNLYSPHPIHDDLEKLELADSLAFLREELGADDPTVKKILASKSPEARAVELVEGTKLKDADYRKRLGAGGIKAIEEATDPMILLARSIDEESRAIRKRYETEVLSAERESYTKIARAIFDIKGTTLYPDATFTLRLSYGVVKGYQENGKQVPPFTTFAGLYRRAAEQNRPPFELPQRWLGKKSALDLETPFCFVSTNDIVGGNSGSPVINKKAEIVGLLFDGNTQSIVGNFVYDDTQNRAISVDARGMIEALRKVYGANELADELTR